MANNYISLHNHSDYSFLDSIAKLSDLAKKAKSLNMDSLAITDHGNICGWLKFYEACRSEKIKPIFGIEAYIVDDASLISKIRNRIEFLQSFMKEKVEDLGTLGYGRLGSLFEHAAMEEMGLNISTINDDLFDENNNFDASTKIQKLEEIKKANSKSNHVIILAKNKNGFKNILKISSEGWTKGMYYKPRIDLKVLEKYKEDIIVSSACLAGQISSSILRKDIKKAEEYLKEYKRIFKDDFYIELQLHEIDEQKIVNKELIKLIKKYNIKPIITQDVHYIEKEDIEVHETVIKLRRKQKDVKEEEKKLEKVENLEEEESDDSYFYTTKNLYFKSYDELKESWKKDHSYIPEEIFNEAIENTIAISKQIENINVRNEKPQLPKFDTGDLSPRQFILKLIKDGSRKKLSKKVEKNSSLKEIYENRMRHELNTICELNFEQYFLIVWDIMRWCKENDVMTGCGRGSAAGSLIAYLLGITDIDPIEHNLIFERFINKSRSGAKYQIELKDFPYEVKK